MSYVFQRFNNTKCLNLCFQIWNLARVACGAQRHVLLIRMEIITFVSEITLWQSESNISIMCKILACKWLSK
jgi:hypothetical protein